jgi:hypothetical protein
MPLAIGAAGLFLAGRRFFLPTMGENRAPGNSLWEK